MKLNKCFIGYFLLIKREKDSIHDLIRWLLHFLGWFMIENPQWKWKRRKLFWIVHIIQSVWIIYSVTLTDHQFFFCLSSSFFSLCIKCRSPTVRVVLNMISETVTIISHFNHATVSFNGHISLSQNWRYRVHAKKESKRKKNEPINDSHRNANRKMNREGQSTRQ